MGTQELSATPEGNGRDTRGLAEYCIDCMCLLEDDEEVICAECEYADREGYDECGD